VILTQYLSRHRAIPLFLAGLNTLVAMAFQLSIIYRLNVGAASDLYYAVTIITVVIYSIIFDPVSNVLIPMFVEKASRDRENAALFWNSLAGTLALGCFILLVAYYPLRLVFPLVFKNLAWVDKAQIGRIIVAYSVYQTLFCAVAVKNCFLFATGKPASAQLGMLAGWMLSLFLLWFMDIPSDVSRIAYCLVAGNLLTLVFPNISSWAFVSRKELTPTHLTAVFTRAVPLTSGSVILKTESLLDGALASLCGVGSLTIYQLFSRLLVAVSTIINSGFIQPVTKDLAELAVNERWPRLRWYAARSAVNSSLTSLTLLLPLAPLLAVLHAWPVQSLEPYVRIIEKNIWTLILMLGYLLGSLIWKVYANGLFVLRGERGFARVCLVTFSLGIVLKVIGTFTFRLPGLALGTSLYWLLAAVAMATTFLKMLRHSATPAPELDQRVVAHLASEVDAVD
jgi:peptidoglycan biosynthesis protein MviN/MurJ (putative lipid II flippase)